MATKSIATINSPEFVNLQPLEINPLMSSCEIKVLYTGENRNGSFISKEVATEMAKTLRGAPIVGYFKEEVNDFRDHGDRMILDDEGIKFECLTIPYGFVSPDAKVWFKEFEESDEFGNTLTREYLMTTGFLWTEQFKESQMVVDEGRPQSMELDPSTLDGHWSTNSKTGMDFFIITDAIFSKLCILGEDVEPCFEGSSVTAPEVSSAFTKMDDNFTKTLHTMMQDLKFALEGGQDMTVENQEMTVETTEETVVTEVAEEVTVETPEVETIVTEEPAVTEEPTPEVESTEVVSEDFVKDDKDEDKDDDNDIDDDNDDADDADDNDDDDDDKKQGSKHSLEEEISELKTAYTELEAKYQALVEFKKEVDNKEKEALIESFYMLSDEDKKDVVENKSNYSLDEIEAKLSVICVRNKVNFDLEDSSKNEEKIEEPKEETPVTTFNVGSDVESVPAFISALKQIRDNRK